MTLRTRSRVQLSLVVFCVGNGIARGQWVEQSFALRSGWNSIFVEVDPAQSRADDLFEELSRHIDLREQGSDEDE